MAEETGLSSWVKDIDRKVDELIVKMTEMHTDLKHYNQRADRQCERIEALEGKVDALENENYKHKGELNTLRIFGIIIGLVATVAVPVVMYFIQRT